MCEGHWYIDIELPGQTVQGNCFIRIETYSNKNQNLCYSICYLLYLILSLTLLFFLLSVRFVSRKDFKGFEGAVLLIGAVLLNSQQIC